MSEQNMQNEFTGATVEDAIQAGLDAMELDMEEVEIEVIEEGSKGLFGLGSKEAVIRLHVRKVPISTEKPQVSSLLEPTRAPKVDYSPYLEKEDLVETEAAEDEDELTAIARETVVELLQKMRVSARVTAQRIPPDSHSSRPAVMVEINGDDLSILIGRRAETLDALEYITRLIVGKEVSGSVIVNLDVQGYKKRKEQRLRRIAQSVARQAIDTGRRQYLEPMSASDRRIIHIELRDHPEVFTESVGEGNRRKVTINPRT